MRKTVKHNLWLKVCDMLCIAWDCGWESSLAQKTSEKFHCSSSSWGCESHGTDGIRWDKSREVQKEKCIVPKIYHDISRYHARLRGSQVAKNYIEGTGLQCGQLWILDPHSSFVFWFAMRFCGGITASPKHHMKYGSPGRSFAMGWRMVEGTWWDVFGTQQILFTSLLQLWFTHNVSDLKSAVLGFRFAVLWKPENSSKDQTWPFPAPAFRSSEFSCLRTSLWSAEVVGSGRLRLRVLDRFSFVSFRVRESSDGCAFSEVRMPALKYLCLKMYIDSERRVFA